MNSGLRNQASIKPSMCSRMGAKPVKAAPEVTLGEGATRGRFRSLLKIVREADVVARRVCLAAEDVDDALRNTVHFPPESNNRADVNRADFRSRALNVRQLRHVRRQSGGQNLSAFPLRASERHPS
jgi:hypothetical protein